MFEEEMEFTGRTVKSKVPEVDGYAVDKAFKGKGGGQSGAAIAAQGFQQILAQKRQQKELKKLNDAIKHRTDAVKRKSMGRSSLLSGSEGGEKAHITTKRKKIGKQRSNIQDRREEAKVQADAKKKIG